MEKNKKYSIMATTIWTLNLMFIFLKNKVKGKKKMGYT